MSNLKKRQLKKKLHKQGMSVWAVVSVQEKAQSVEPSCYRRIIGVFSSQNEAYAELRRLVRFADTFDMIFVYDVIKFRVDEEAKTPLLWTRSEIKRNIEWRERRERLSREQR